MYFLCLVILLSALWCCWFVWASVVVTGCCVSCLRGFDCVSRFLLPPCVFCGLGVSRLGRVKDLWNGYSGCVRFSESFCLFLTVGTFYAVSIPVLG